MVNFELKPVREYIPVPRPNDAERYYQRLLLLPEGQATVAATGITVLIS